MILKVDGLSFAYKSRRVIDDAGFELKEGEILSILGPNGAGKTTLLKCLNLILSPDRGTVLIDGKNCCDISHGEMARKTGLVAQHSEPVRMKVYDLVLLGRKPHFHWSPRKEDHAIVEEAIKLMGLEELALRYADELSGGEFQLVQIVRALAQRPRLILFDEPTSSLDISHQHQLMARIGRLIHSKPMAAVMTMHDINLALRYSDKFLLIREGRVHAAGGKEIINPENIKEVYGMESAVTEACGHTIVIPV